MGKAATRIPVKDLARRSVPAQAAGPQMLLALPIATHISLHWWLSAN